MIEVFREILPFAIKVAPMVASMLVSPVSGFSTMAVELLSQAFGVESKNPEELVAKIAQTPEAESILQAVESKYSPYLKYFSNIKMPQKVRLSVELEWP